MGHKEVNSLAVDQLVSYQLCLTAKPFHYATLPANNGILRTGPTVRLIWFCTRHSDFSHVCDLEPVTQPPWASGSSAFGGDGMFYILTMVVVT